MSLVKCRYVTMGCNQSICVNDENGYPKQYQCEWQDEEGGYECCRFAEQTEHYIEGEYKRIEFDGETLFIKNKEIALTREKSYYGEEFEEGIHYLEIGGHIYINDDGEEEQGDAVHGSGQSPDEEKQSDCGQSYPDTL